MLRRRSVSPGLVIAFASITLGAVTPSGAGEEGTRLAATPTARYTVRFDATWTAASHPLEYPGNAHWSALVGGTHDGTIQFWQNGQLASTGIKDMAERGLTSTLSAEVQAQINAGHAGVVILGGGIAGGAGIATATFDASQ